MVHKRSQGWAVGLPSNPYAAVMIPGKPLRAGSATRGRTIWSPELCGHRRSDTGVGLNHKTLVDLRFRPADENVEGSDSNRSDLRCVKHHNVEVRAEACLWLENRKHPKIEPVRVRDKNPNPPVGKNTQKNDNVPYQP